MDRLFCARAKLSRDFADIQVGDCLRPHDIGVILAPSRFTDHRVFDATYFEAIRTDFIDMAEMIRPAFLVR
ncbi:MULTISPECIES: hypothetical protein [unclassified Pseudomonas]|uniref:hypothetical protein n=1 Tax=unclassified Pseudomonas TaxID=196821 RepID=UPI0030DB1E41